MAAIVKLCKTTQNSTFFIIYSDNFGVLKCESFLGDTTSLRNRLIQIIDAPIVIGENLLLEDNSYMLLEDTYKILLEV
jgi:hypothetical protein